LHERFFFVLDDWLLVEAVLFLATRDCLLSPWPAASPSDDSAPNKPTAATMTDKRKTKERKFRFMILIIEVLLN